MQAHSNGGPLIVSNERVRQKEIGTRGLTSGTIMQLLAGNSKSHLAIGHTQHTRNGYGTPPQSTTFTELRTELFTIIYQHSPNVIPAQVWHGMAYGFAVLLAVCSAICSAKFDFFLPGRTLNG